MCKFENERAPGFDLVAEGIQSYANDAPELIKNRWDAERSEQLAQKRLEVAELYNAASMEYLTFTIRLRTNKIPELESVQGTPQSDSTETFTSSSGKAPTMIAASGSQPMFEDRYIVEEMEKTMFRIMRRRLVESYLIPERA